MNIWKTSFFITLLILIVTNLFWLYVVIDNGVTYTYQQTSLNEKDKAIDMLGSLIVKGGQRYTKKEILHLLRQANQDAFIVDEKNTIDVDGVQFIFNHGKLSNIQG